MQTPNNGKAVFKLNLNQLSQKKPSNGKKPQRQKKAGLCFQDEYDDQQIFVRDSQDSGYQMPPLDNRNVSGSYQPKSNEPKRKVIFLRKRVDEPIHSQQKFRTQQGFGVNRKNLNLASYNSEFAPDPAMNRTQLDEAKQALHGRRMKTNLFVSKESHTKIRNTDETISDEQYNSPFDTLSPRKSARNDAMGGKKLVDSQDKRSRNVAALTVGSILKQQKTVQDHEADRFFHETVNYPSTLQLKQLSKPPSNPNHIVRKILGNWDIYADGKQVVDNKRSNAKPIGKSMSKITNMSKTQLMARGSSHSSFNVMSFHNFKSGAKCKGKDSNLNLEKLDREQYEKLCLEVSKRVQNNQFDDNLIQYHKLAMISPRTLANVQDSNGRVHVQDQIDNRQEQLTQRSILKNEKNAAARPLIANDSIQLGGNLTEQSQRYETQQNALQKRKASMGSQYQLKRDLSKEMRDLKSFLNHSRFQKCWQRYESNINRHFLEQDLLKYGSRSNIKLQRQKNFMQRLGTYDSKARLEMQTQGSNSDEPDVVGDLDEYQINQSLLSVAKNIQMHESSKHWRSKSNIDHGSYRAVPNSKAEGAKNESAAQKPSTSNNILIREGEKSSLTDEQPLVKRQLKGEDVDESRKQEGIMENLDKLRGSAESLAFLRQIVDRPNLMDQNDIYVYKRNLARLKHEIGDANAFKVDHDWKGALRQYDDGRVKYKKAEKKDNSKNKGSFQLGADLADQRRQTLGVSQKKPSKSISRNKKIVYGSLNRASLSPTLANLYNEQQRDIFKKKSPFGSPVRFSTYEKLNNTSDLYFCRGERASQLQRTSPKSKLNPKHQNIEQNQQDTIICNPNSLINRQAVLEGQIINHAIDCLPIDQVLRWASQNHGSKTNLDHGLNDFNSSQQVSLMDGSQSNLGTTERNTATAQPKLKIVNYRDKSLRKMNATMSRFEKLRKQSQNNIYNDLNQFVHLQVNGQSQLEKELQEIGQVKEKFIDMTAIHKNKHTNEVEPPGGYNDIYYQSNFN